jgi:hypothetical protein
MASYFTNMAGVADQASQFSEETARASLMEHYKSDEAMTQAVGRAFRTAQAFLPDASFERLMATAGNIPEVITLLDAVGKEMAEDPGVHPDAILDGESLDHLMRGGPGADDSPYWNADDPRHKAVKAKVTKHHEAKASATRRKAA